MICKDRFYIIKNSKTLWIYIKDFYKVWEDLHFLTILSNLILSLGSYFVSFIFLTFNSFINMKSTICLESLITWFLVKKIPKFSSGICFCFSSYFLNFFLLLCHPFNVWQDLNCFLIFCNLHLPWIFYCVFLIRLFF